MIDLYPEGCIRVISSVAGITLKQALPLNQWSHLAVTVGDGKFRVYLNGKVIHEAAAGRGTPKANSLPVRLGADHSGGSRFVGKMDDVRIYSRALTADEVAALAK